MLRVASIIVVLLPSLCGAIPRVVRGKNGEGMISQDDLNIGFVGAENLPVAKWQQAVQKQAKKVATVASASLSVLNVGKDCWPSCAKGGLCEAFCGQGNACCGVGFAADGPICKDAKHKSGGHQCVAPAFASAPRTQKMVSSISASAVIKIDQNSNHPQAPSFTKDEGSGDDPNIVETIPYANSEISMSMLPFLACAAVMMVWITLKEQRKKSKADGVKGMMAPLVQDAMGAIGEVTRATGKAQMQAQAALQSSFQKVGSEYDELLNDEPEKKDEYF